jgi:hypothetical protein
MFATKSLVSRDSGNRLPAWGPIKRSFTSRTWCRRRLGVTTCSLVMIAGLDIVVVGIRFGSSFDGARFGSPLLYWSRAFFDVNCR